MRRQRKGDKKRRGKTRGEQMRQDKGEKRPNEKMRRVERGQ